jgi:hypothetical protein
MPMLASPTHAIPMPYACPTHAPLSSLYRPPQGQLPELEAMLAQFTFANHICQHGQPTQKMTVASCLSELAWGLGLGLPAISI